MAEPADLAQLADAPPRGTLDALLKRLRDTPLGQGLVDTFRRVVPPGKPDWFNPQPRPDGPQLQAPGHRADLRRQAEAALAPQEGDPRKSFQQTTAAIRKGAPELAHHAFIQPIIDIARAANPGASDKELLDGAFAALGQIGGPATAIFAGPMARTANKQALHMAQEMQRRNMPREQIWDATGWFQGADKKWKFEIPDEASRIVGQGQPTMRETLSHPDLYKAYPQLEQIAMQQTSKPGTAYYQRGAFPGDIETISTSKAPNRATLTHELQHAVQNTEGFTPGGSSAFMREVIPPEIASRATSEQLNSAASMAYRRLAGEVEARNAAARLHFNPAERKAQYPWMTEDVPADLQIVRKPELGL